MRSISTSIAELYQAGANPRRVRKNKIKQLTQPRARKTGQQQYPDAGLAQLSQISEQLSSRRSSRSSSSRRSSSGSSSRRSGASSSHSAGSNHSSSSSSLDVHARANFAHVKPNILQTNQQDREQEKLVYLQELARMRATGQQTRGFDAHTPYEQVKFEFERAKQAENQISSVSFMKDIIRLTCSGMELAATRYTPLKLNGWSQATTEDMTRFDRPLTRLYQRYWRQGSISPVLELGFLLFGSMMIHHFKTILGPGLGPMFAAATQQFSGMGNSNSNSNNNNNSNKNNNRPPAPFERPAMRTMQRPAMQRPAMQRSTMQRPAMQRSAMQRPTMQPPVPASQPFISTPNITASPNRNRESNLLEQTQALRESIQQTRHQVEEMKSQMQTQQQQHRHMPQPVPTTFQQSFNAPVPQAAAFMMIDVAQQQARTPATTATVEILEDDITTVEEEKVGASETTAETALQDDESLSIQSMEEGTQNVGRNNNPSQTTSYTFRLN